MSYSIGVRGTLGELGEKLEDSYGSSNYGDAHEAVGTHVRIAIDAVETLADKLSDDGEFSCSFYGHAHYGEADGTRDSFTLAISPFTAPVGSGG